jgi:glycosyltransferase involved in cell wall biosynthesis
LPAAARIGGVVARAYRNGTAVGAPVVARTAEPCRVLVIGSLARSLINFRGPLLEAMVRRGHRVTACAPAAAPEIRDALQRMGVAYRHVPAAPTGMNPVRDLATFTALWRLMRDVRPDVVLSYTIKPVVYGLLAARLAGVPRRFAMITGLGYAFGEDGLHARLAGAGARGLYRLGLAGSAAVFFQNPDDHAAFARLGLLRSAGRPIRINGSGVDLAHYAPAPLPPEPSFLLLARLLKDKGIMEYVEAARLLRTRYPRARFRLAGWFDHNPMALRRESLAAWERDGVVEYLGSLSDVRPAIAASSVYVLPSYREGTPRTVLEAMAMGRPVVTTDAPGCRETVVPGRNGFLVPVKDAGALAAAMERFVAEPALVARMGAESRRMAEEKYDVHKVNGVILEAMGL